MHLDLFHIWMLEAYITHSHGKIKSYRSALAVCHVHSWPQTARLPHIDHVWINTDLSQRSIRWKTFQTEFHLNIRFVVQTFNMLPVIGGNKILFVSGLVHFCVWRPWKYSCKATPAHMSKGRGGCSWEIEMSVVCTTSWAAIDKFYNVVSWDSMFFTNAPLKSLRACRPRSCGAEALIGRSIEAHWGPESSDLWKSIGVYSRFGTSIDLHRPPYSSLGPRGV